LVPCHTRYLSAPRLAPQRPYQSIRVQMLQRGSVTSKDAPCVTLYKIPIRAKDYTTAVLPHRQECRCRNRGKQPRERVDTLYKIPTRMIELHGIDSYPSRCVQSSRLPVSVDVLLREMCSVSRLTTTKMPPSELSVRRPKRHDVYGTSEGPFAMH
jgi:hypothetical protein